jgi:predicted nucleotidyltransferase
MESNAESPIIIQMLKNVKQIIETSKDRKCWKEEEYQNIDNTYHNVSEILRQLQEREPKTIEEITGDPVLEPDPSSGEGMEEIN